ncbi:WhiB family transcriptional regulator [Nocardia flavorosea]|uniref:WhiB family transcriptional regulator n=1 Tax=Nocardia flavorosea TaxID=53429 RepID=UPI0024571EDB|nr:WhiB family transcriptional regulator [Nocardia flavorosea]
MSTTNDPIYRSDRACAGRELALFFPSPGRMVAVRKAQEVCASCPVLAQCAAWAAPLVERKDLVECVVGGVQVPAWSARIEKFRETAQELAEVALLGHLPDAEIKAA